MRPPDRIVCVECGGDASLISFLPEDEEEEPATIFAYRCADCLERSDVEFDDE